MKHFGGTRRRRRQRYFAKSPRRSTEKSSSVPFAPPACMCRAGDFFAFCFSCFFSSLLRCFVASLLFHRHAFCEVSRHVGIVPALYREVISKNLRRYHVCQRG